MLVFLDFEASSLSKRSYPIEVGWVFEDGRCEEHLIRPAPDWTEWDPGAELIHGLSRNKLELEGTPHDVVAHRMVEALAGHDLLASAPSWDGKWLSLLLRSAGLPRRALRLRDSDDALLAVAKRMLSGSAAAADLDETAAALVAEAEARLATAPPTHRALADAIEERRLFLAVRDAAALRAGQLNNMAP